MIGNFPHFTRDQVAPALFDNVLPRLAEMMHETAVMLATDECGGEPDAFTVERMGAALLYALTDFCSLSAVPGHTVHDVLRWHQLHDPAYAAAYFKLDSALTYQLAGRFTPAAITPADAAEVAEAIADVLGKPAPAEGKETKRNKRRTCAREKCKKSFTPARKHQRYCSDACRHAQNSANARRRNRGTSAA